MYDLSSPDFWIVAGAGLVIGLFMGWVLTSLLQRRANAGASVAQLREEMEDYREEVNTHFTRTAELFKDTTEKYRDLYEHLAGGAQDLCNDLPDQARVEFRPGHLLATGTETAEETGTEAVATPPPENGNDAGAPAKAPTASVVGKPQDIGPEKTRSAGAT